MMVAVWTGPNQGRRARSQDPSSDRPGHVIHEPGQPGQEVEETTMHQLFFEAILLLCQLPLAGGGVR
eukprot:2230754-Prymnesium_polylepis.2